jgi:hypothetical protein
MDTTEKRKEMADQTLFLDKESNKEEEEEEKEEIFSLPKSPVEGSKSRATQKAKKHLKSSYLIGFTTLLGLVLGEVFAACTKAIPALAWLSYRVNLGLTTPVVLDLALFKLTIGFYLILTPGVLIFTGLGVLAGFLWVKNR